MVGHAPAGRHPIVLFDGVCGLCDGFVTWLLRRDRAGIFRVAPLQGETALRHVSPHHASDPETWSILLVEDGRVLQRSDAVLRIVPQLGGMFRLAALLRFIPRVLRDAVYNVIARNRYRWFGKRDACRVPTAAERKRFLP